MMPNGELGYVFKSAVTANGCLMLCITPHARRRDFHSKVYVFTADEVRALIEALAVMPDGPEEIIRFSPGYSPVFFRIFRVPDAIRAIENVTPLMPRMARARHT